MLKIQQYLRASSQQEELDSVLEELEVFSGTDSRLIQLEAEYGIKSRRHASEFLNYFPQMVDIYNRLEEKYKKLIVDIESTWKKTKDIKDQKEFAIQVKDLPYSGLLFEKRRNGGSVKELIIKMKQPLFLKLIGVK